MWPENSRLEMSVFPDGHFTARECPADESPSCKITAVFFLPGK
jgi:hypothetical protein